MHLVSVGFTTNEKVKVSCLKEDLQLAIEKRMMAVRDIPDLNDEINKAKYIEIKEDISSLREKLKTVKDINYSRGFWQNLLTILRA